MGGWSLFIIHWPFSLIKVSHATQNRVWHLYCEDQRFRVDDCFDYAPAPMVASLSLYDVQYPQLKVNVNANTQLKMLNEVHAAGQTL